MSVPRWFFVMLAVCMLTVTVIASWATITIVQRPGRRSTDTERERIACLQGGGQPGGVLGFCNNR